MTQACTHADTQVYNTHTQESTWFTLKKKYAYIPSTITRKLERLCKNVQWRDAYIVHKHTYQMQVCNTRIQTHTHTHAWWTSTFHQLDNGAGLTAKSLWHPYYEKSQPGHETWMTLFPHTHTVTHLGNGCTTDSTTQNPSHCEMTCDTCVQPFHQECDLCSQGGQWQRCADRFVSHNCYFQVWTGTTVSHTGMPVFFKQSSGKWHSAGKPCATEV